jgi:hypothetical protein
MSRNLTRQLGACAKCMKEARGSEWMNIATGVWCVVKHPDINRCQVVGVPHMHGTHGTVLQAGGEAIY